MPWRDPEVPRGVPAVMSRIVRYSVKLWGPLILVLVISCSGAQDSTSTGNEPPDDSASETPLQPDVESMTGALDRQGLLDVLGRSAGDFLRLIEIEHEADGGRFLGWRIVALPSTTPSWLDVHVGDVVTAVNGMGVERPEDAQQIWEILQVASEIRIDLTRDGERRSVRVPVEDTVAEETSTDLQPDPRGPEE